MSLIQLAAAILAAACLLLHPEEVRGTWYQTWSDEFDGPAGSPPDQSKWGYDIGDGGDGWGNQEKEYYTDSTQNAGLDGNGFLLITATRDGADQYQCYYGPCQYTSARINTKGKFSQVYGRFEARLKLPYNQGVWPAFWALGSNIDSVGWPTCGEIDIMEERGSLANQNEGSIHGPGYTGDIGIHGDYTLPYGDFSQDFHIFAIEWDDDSVHFFVDDTDYFSQTKEQVEAQGWPWEFDHQFFIILNFAVGGVMDGDPGPDTPFPQSLVVDYVRVYGWG